MRQTPALEGKNQPLGRDMGGKPVQVLAEDAYWNSKRGTIYPKLGRWSPGRGEEERGKSLGKGRNPIAVQLIIQSLTSLRGVEKTLELLSKWWKLPTPDFSSIRHWGLRLGLYELTREKDYRSDWIFILDMTLELGRNKCLVILGITQERFTQIIQQEQRGLQHQDVEVLALEILEQSPGKIIEEKLKNLAERVGTPLQILSDRGSDLKLHLSTGD